ncbi:MAG TPA: L,D-transpeptidase, partial [Thermoanaerobaculia bacterium]|nr:L,D-transpeptidase [Thermoanaerobaculia bacterium]
FMSKALVALALGFVVLTAMPLAAQPVSYRLEPAPEDLDERFDSGQLALLEMLNRADRQHLPRLDQLILPDRWNLPLLEYSPLPKRIDELAGRPKALVVHQPQQVFGAYEHGDLVRWGPVSSGRREHPTPSGEFHLNWRSPGRHSTVDPEWYMEWYFNFHNRRGLALHQFALPGTPASHACVRLLERDARWIYDWGEGWTLDARGWDVVETGTPLWIIGDYDFNAPPPWVDASTPHAPIDITSADVGEH